MGPSVVLLLAMVAPWLILLAGLGNWLVSQPRWSFVVVVLVVVATVGLIALNLFAPRPCGTWMWNVLHLFQIAALCGVLTALWAFAQLVTNTREDPATSTA